MGLLKIFFRAMVLRPITILRCRKDGQIPQSDKARHRHNLSRLWRQVAGPDAYYPANAFIIVTHRRCIWRFHIKSGKCSPKGSCHPCSSPNDFCVGWRRGKTGQNALVCMVIASALYSGAFRQQVHPVSAPTEGDFPQCGEIFQREKLTVARCA